MASDATSLVPSSKSDCKTVAITDTDFKSPPPKIRKKKILEEDDYEEVSDNTMQAL